MKLILAIILCAMSASCACFYPGLDGAYSYIGYTPGMTCIVRDDGVFECGPSDEYSESKEEYRTGKMHKRGPVYSAGDTARENNE